MATNVTDYDSLEAQAAMTWEHTKLSVKQQEAAFVKGAAKGVASSVVRGAVAIPALFRAIGPYYNLEDVAQLDKDTKNLMADKLDIEGQETGFDAGNTVGDVAQVVLDPAVGAAKGAAKAGLLIGLTDKTGGIPPKLAFAAGEAYEGFRSGKTAMQIWKEYGLVDLNFGVKDAPIELARYLPMNELRIAEGAVVDASGMERTLAQALVDSKENGMPIATVLAGTKLFDDDHYKWLFDRSSGGQGYRLVLDDTLAPNELGYHSPMQGIIAVNRKLFDDKTGQFSDTGIRTLAHELQHAIQFGEDWLGKGSNTTDAYKQVSSVENALKTRVLNVQKRAVAKVLEVWKERYWPLAKEAQERRRVYEEARTNPDINPTQLWDLQRDAMEYARKVGDLLKDSPFERDRKALAEVGIKLPTYLSNNTILRLNENMEDTVNGIFSLETEAVKLSYDHVFKFYENDIGEVWARVAAKTHHMSAEDMANSAPWRYMDRASPRTMSARGDATKGFWGELIDEEQAIKEKAP